MQERYSRNYPAVSEEEQALLKTKTVCVIGCGGLGGYVINALARIGVGKLILIDCDVFSESNLNRQLINREDNLGKGKAEEAAFFVKSINSEVETVSFHQMLTEDNAEDLLDGADVVVDALDNIKGRLTAERACEKLGLYFVHGAAAGWRSQVSVIAPGSRSLEKIFPAGLKAKPPAVLPFAPGFTASVQVSETLKLLLGREDTLEGKLFMADLQHMTFATVEL